jgi:flagellar biosynthetic protein FliR
VLSTLVARYFFPAVFVGLRVAGLMSFAPFLGNSALPTRVKAGLTVAITILLVPSFSLRSVPLTVGSWLQTALGEAALGILMGLSVQFVFEGFQLAGEVVGVQMGFALESMFDPQTNASSPVLSVFYQTIALLIFLELNVHHWMLLALAQSFRLVPVGAVRVGLPAARAMLRAATAMWVIGIEIAAPVLIATMAVDLALSFLSRISPQVPVLLVGLSLKQLLGYLLMVGTIVMWPTYLQHRFMAAIVTSERMLHLLH